MNGVAAWRADLPRVVLAGVRLVNGAGALVAPKALMQRLGVDAQASPAVVYGLRMFGIRTVLISLDLMSKDPDVRAHAVRAAPIIHGTDALAAAFAGIRGDLPRRAALTATAISAINFVLAMKAQREVQP